MEAMSTVRKPMEVMYGHMIVLIGRDGTNSQKDDLRMSGRMLNK